MKNGGLVINGIRVLPADSYLSQNLKHVIHIDKQGKSMNNLKTSIIEAYVFLFNTTPEETWKDWEFTMLMKDAQQKHDE